ncbi:hypothetical protein [Nocardia nova]|uniref:hypothetical protein n=1 Tax=Nocardia nova TaxID=37330 RepID=UPI003CCBB937
MLGAAIWVAVLVSGVHGTLAAVLLWGAAWTCSPEGGCRKQRDSAMPHRPSDAEPPSRYMLVHRQDHASTPLNDTARTRSYCTYIAR